MAIHTTLRGRIRGPKEVELEHELDLPLGSEITLSIALGGKVTKTFERFKRAAGSWKDIPESFIANVYADRHLSTRSDVVL